MVVVRHLVRGLCAGVGGGHAAGARAGGGRAGGGLGLIYVLLNLKLGPGAGACGHAGSCRLRTRRPSSTQSKNSELGEILKETEKEEKTLLEKSKELNQPTIFFPKNFSEGLKVINKDFCDFVLEQHKSIMHTMGYVPQDLGFSGMWGVEQNKHGYHRQHYHPNNWMCGVFYVDTHEDDAIVFHYPRLRAGAIQPKTFDYNEYNTSINRFPSPEGKIYMFPHWLEHSVEPLVHDKTRISISWNIKIPEKLGCGYGCTDG